MFWLSEESLNLFLVCMMEAARGRGSPRRGRREDGRRLGKAAESQRASRHPTKVKGGCVHPWIPYPPPHVGEGLLGLLGACHPTSGHRARPDLASSPRARATPVPALSTPPGADRTASAGPLARRALG